jgi:hypothetical protein
MRYLVCTGALILAGCTAVTTAPPQSRTADLAEAVVPATRTRDPQEQTVTRYELGAYRYPRETGPSAVAVLRPTHVPAALARRPESVGLLQESSSAPYAPLLASEELNAELNAQRAITAQLRALEAAIVSLERESRAQYQALLRQRDATGAVRKELEEERRRLQALQARLRERLDQEESTPTIAAVSVPASTSKQGPEW